MRLIPTIAAQKNIHPPYVFTHLGDSVQPCSLMPDLRPVKVLAASPMALAACAEKKLKLAYGFQNTDINVDKAYICFENVKRMTLVLAEVENSIYRLTNSIRKTQTRANALQNIVIPRYEAIVKYISGSLEEKEREEFSRMKVIKAQKMRKKYRIKK